MWCVVLGRYLPIALVALLSFMNGSINDSSKENNDKLANSIAITLTVVSCLPDFVVYTTSGQGTHDWFIIILFVGLFLSSVRKTSRNNY